MIKEYCQARLQKFVVTSLYFKCGSKKTIYEKRRVQKRMKEGQVFSEGFFFLMPQTRER